MVFVCKEIFVTDLQRLARQLIAPQLMGRAVMRHQPNSALGLQSGISETPRGRPYHSGRRYEGPSRPPHLKGGKGNT